MGDIPVTKNRMEDGGNTWSVGGILNVEADATLHVAEGAAVDGLTGQTTFASAAEAKAGTNTTKVISPSTLAADLANLKILTFTGHNLAGACALVGAAIGDKVIAVAGLTDMGGAKASFETTITVADQIQQSAATDLHAKNFVAYLLPVV